MKNAIAIEFGGQSIKAAIIDLHGNMTSYKKMILSQENPPPYDVFVREFGSLLKATKGNRKISAAGIAHPNPCDCEDLTFRLVQKPAYKYVNGHSLKSLILDGIGLSEYHTIYDAGAAGLGELWLGKIEEQGRFLLLTLGTGLGAVFIEGGLIVTGRHVQGIPDSGELWDYQYRETDLENVTGTTKAAVSIYRELGGTSPEVLDGDLKRLASMGRENLDGGIAQKTFAEFGRRLSDSLAPIVKKFGPEAIILSGNIAHATDLFEGAAKQALRTRLEGSNIITNFIQSDLIDRGGLLGAAFRAFYPSRPIRQEEYLKKQ
jgi:glucokinase